MTDLSDGVAELWEYDNEMEDAMSTMDIDRRVFNTNKDTTKTCDVDMMVDKEIDGVVVKWDPTIPKSNIHQVDMSRTLNLKRKRVKGHRSTKLREIKIEHQILTEFKIPKIEPKLSQIQFHENDVTMEFDEPISYGNIRNVTLKQTEVMYYDTLSQLSKLCMNEETHKLVSQSVSLGKYDETQKLDREIDETVSQLVSLSLNESCPRNIYDEYQTMKVLKTFQNLKI